MSQQTPPVFNVFPKELILRFAWFQVFLASFPIATFVLVNIEWLGLPLQSSSLEWPDPEFMNNLGEVMLIISCFTFAALFCCLGLFISHAGREEHGSAMPTTNPDRALSTMALDELRVQRAKALINSINFLGLVFGILTVFIFMGGFISGTLFPSFGQNDTNATHLEVVAALMSFGLWAKLAVWSFLFGFSERLLPNLLNNFSRQLENDGADKEKADTPEGDRADRASDTEKDRS